jgi:hypothetical protein
MGADQEANETGVGCRSLIRTIDDEFHLHARPLERGLDCQSDHAVEVDRVGSGRCVRRPAIGLVAERVAAGQERLPNEVRLQVDVDPIAMDLGPSDEQEGW